MSSSQCPRIGKHNSPINYLSPRERPMNEKPEIAIIISAQERQIHCTTSRIILGRICTSIIRILLAPQAIAHMMYALSYSPSIKVLTNLIIRRTSDAVSATNMVGILFPNMDKDNQISHRRNRCNCVQNTFCKNISAASRLCQQDAKDDT